MNRWYLVGDNFLLPRFIHFLDIEIIEVPISLSNLMIYVS